MPSVTVDLTTLESEISDLENRLAELKAVRKWLSGKLEVAAASSTTTRTHTSTSRIALRDSRPLGSVTPGPGAMDHLKVHDAAAKILTEFNHGLSLSRLTEVLSQRGYGDTLANLKNALSTAMTRHTEMFAKTDDGTWFLKPSYVAENAS